MAKADPIIEELVAEQEQARALTYYMFMKTTDVLWEFSERRSNIRIDCFFWKRE